ncbi:alpha-L-fucosidase [Tessaracoccus sp. OH4464_COT-324]|uniref:alpha-L-fucosidase n=1 Tax=Tessaracoccus sp. OH4464_COT-324 TaxID=2491059 RepID=UPI001F232FF1|nr:alpha-L-fucosidase [Tessaracoccus sp. OH4464_COT-324]
MLAMVATPARAVLNTGEVDLDEVKGVPAVVPHSDSERIANWQKLQFGLFMHWGVYSMFAGSYNGTPQGIGYPEQIKAWMKIPDDVYLQEAAKMTAEKWDAGHVCRTAKNAGMNYVMITTKHHDGFAMWDTKTTDYNVVKKTAFGKDPLKQLQQECAKVDVKLAFYFSIIDWTKHEAEPYRNLNPIPESMMPYILAQIDELMTGYGPIAEFWFDMGAPTADQSARMADRVRQHQPDVTVVNSRVWNDKGDFEVGGDNAVPRDFRIGPWESILSIFPACWSYCNTSKANRSEESLERKTISAIDGLVTVVSGGGQFAYNVGPKGDGSFDPYDQRVLDNIGEWMKRHPKAISGAQATWFPVPEWGRITANDNALYFFVPKSTWSGGRKVSLAGLANKVRSVAIDGGKALEFTQTGAELSVTLDGDAPDSFMNVIKVELDGTPRMVPQQTVRLVKGSGVIEGSDLLSRNGAKRYPVAVDSYVLGDSDKAVDSVQLTFTASGLAPETKYRVWFGDNSVEVTGQELLDGSVGEGFKLEPNQVARIRLELAKPVYYATPLGVRVSKVEVSAESAEDSAPEFVVQPMSQSVVEGAEVEFRARAVGRPAPTYQWYRVSAGKERKLEGETSPTLSFEAQLSDNEARYFVVATNALGEQRSESALLTVREAAANLALNKPSRQISTGWGGLASRANDGNTDGVWDNQSVSHTAHATDPWWEVDLGKSYDLTEVNVWNRSNLDRCGAESCDQRLKDFVLLVSEKPFPEVPLSQQMVNPDVQAVQVPGVAGYPSVVQMAGKKGRYLRVVLPGTSKQLALAEVEVFGKKPSSAPEISELEISGEPAEDIKPITSDRPAVQVKLGATLRLAVEAAGTPAPEITWQRNTGDWTQEGANWVDLEAKGPEFTLEVAAEHNQWVVRAVAVNEAGEAATDPLSIVVVSEPSFTAQPKPIEVKEGEQAAFEVAVDGLPTPGVEWLRALPKADTEGAADVAPLDDDPIWESVGEGLKLEFTATKELNGALFKAVATNPSGSIATEPVMLRVIADTPVPDPTPSPDPAPVPDPTPSPDPAPVPDPTPSPDPAPVPDPTPSPDPAPVPDPTPSPDPAPVPDPTPSPDPTPRPGPSKPAPSQPAPSKPAPSKPAKPKLPRTGV